MLVSILVSLGILIILGSAVLTKILWPLPPHRNPKYFWNTTKYGGRWCRRCDYLKPGEKFVEEEEWFNGDYTSPPNKIM